MKLEMPDSNMSENSKYSLLLLGSVLLLVFPPSPKIKAAVKMTEPYK